MNHNQQTPWLLNIIKHYGSSSLMNTNHYPSLTVTKHPLGLNPWLLLAATNHWLLPHAPWWSPSRVSWCTWPRWGGPGEGPVLVGAAVSSWKESIHDHGEKQTAAGSPRCIFVGVLTWLGLRNSMMKIDQQVSNWKLFLVNPFAPSSLSPGAPNSSESILSLLFWCCMWFSTSTCFQVFQVNIVGYFGELWGAIISNDWETGGSTYTGEIWETM